MDIFNLYLTLRLEPRPTKTCLLQRKDGPSNLSKNVINYLWEVFLLGEETGTMHKANPRDVAMRMKGMRRVAGRRDSRKKSDSATKELINSKKVIFSTVHYLFFSS